MIMKTTVAGQRSSAVVAKQGHDPKTFSKKVQEYLECEATCEAIQTECGSWNSIEEMEAHSAQGSITLARQEILKLQAKIEKWEQVIAASNRVIRRYKRKQTANTFNKPGRPVRSKFKEQAAREFSMKWVASLIEALDAKGCGAKRGLEMLVPTTQERNWRRWLKGEAVPSYSTVESLLEVKVAHGKYAGKTLCQIPVVPSHDQFMTLLRFL